MNIGINLLPFREIAGIVVYTSNLLENFGKINSNDNFYIFTSKNTPKNLLFDFPNFHYIKINLDSKKRIHRVLYEQFLLPGLLKKYNINAIFNPTLAGPVCLPKGIKQITTIHDCAYDRFNEFDSLLTKVYFKIMFLSATKFSADHIITISEFSKKEISEIYHVPTEKITTIHEGPPSLPLVGEDDIEKTIKKFQLQDKKFFLYVGNWRPRKNLINLLKAFARYTKEYSNYNTDYYLVLAGKKDERFVNLTNIAKEEKILDKIIFTDFVSEKDKVALYKKTEALLFPSYYEGFGLPILEAQSLGVPVLTSNTTSMPEVAGNAAIFVDPYSIESIANGIRELAQNEKTKNKLSLDGIENVKNFSWKNTAKQTLNVIKSKHQI